MNKGTIIVYGQVACPAPDLSSGGDLIGAEAEATPALLLGARRHRMEAAVVANGVGDSAPHRCRVTGRSHGGQQRSAGVSIGHQGVSRGQQESTVVNRGQQGLAGVNSGQQGSAWANRGQQGSVGDQQGAAEASRGQQRSAGSAGGQQGLAGASRGSAEVSMGQQRSTGFNRGQQGSA